MCSFQFVLRKLAGVRIISSALRLDISVCLSVWGWYAVDRDVLVFTDADRALQNLLVKIRSLSQIILSGSPWCWVICYLNSWAIICTYTDFDKHIGQIISDSPETTLRIPISVFVLGKVAMKSMVAVFHYRSGKEFECKNPNLMWFCALIIW